MSIQLVDHAFWNTHLKVSRRWSRQGSRKAPTVALAQCGHILFEASSVWPAVKGACQQWVHVVCLVQGFKRYLKDILSRSTKTVTVEGGAGREAGRAQPSLLHNVVISFLKLRLYDQEVKGACRQWVHVVPLVCGFYSWAQPMWKIYVCKAQKQTVT